MVSMIASPETHATLAPFLDEGLAFLYLKLYRETTKRAPADLSPLSTVAVTFEQQQKGAAAVAALEIWLHSGSGEKGRGELAEIEAELMSLLGVFHTEPRVCLRLFYRCVT